MADLDLYDWPEELPQEVYTDSGPDYAAQDNTIRTANTTGPAKLRKRFSAITADVTVGLEMSESEIAVLEDFVKNKLGETAQFNWIKFHTGEACRYRFKAGWSSVKLKYFGGDVWTVSMDLELMP